MNSTYMPSSLSVVRVAVLDLNAGLPNQGMRCIREILEKHREEQQLLLEYDIFEVRTKDEVPGTEYDIYISSGGPGSPFDGEGLIWESKYFKLLDDLQEHNRNNPRSSKHFFFICHSFQIACRYFGLGQVVQRKSTSFGVFPVHKTKEGEQEPILSGLNDPFYVVDSRNWQVIQPDHEKIEMIGATVLALEKIRPHVDLERCIMAVRFNDCFFGTQFHPEADSTGMSEYLQTEEKRITVIENHGLEKYESMVTQLNDPDKISLTQSMILPTFLDIAIHTRQSVLS
jgi:GMP synthase-like glutamine amidotransferase